MPDPIRFAVLTPEGEIEMKTELLTLEVAQKVVGGYIMNLRTWLPSVALYVNEDGLHLKLPPNPLASFLTLGYELVGTALVFHGGVEDTEVSLTDSDVAAIFMVVQNLEFLLPKAP